MPNAPTLPPADDPALPRRTRLLLVGMAALACAWPAWLVFGLRFTTHDDLALSWVALDPRIGWWEFADFVARLQLRVQAYVWMPVWLLGNRLAEAQWAQLLFAGHVSLLVALLAWLAGRLAGARIGVLYALLLGFGFALHPYFMAPPGFPLVGLGPPLALLICLFALHRSQGGDWRWLGLSLLAWLLVAMGPEYNVPAFGPLLLLGILVFVQGLRGRLRVLLLFGAVSALYVGVAFAFRLSLGTSADAQRVTVSLSADWWPTFWPLLRNALLPGVLLGGARLDVAAIGGMPALPGRFSLGWLAGVLRGEPGYLVVAALLWAAFAALLGGRRLDGRMRLGLLVVALPAALAPPAILALSATYQAIVPPEHLQGHLASASVQAGLMAVVAVLLGGWAWGWKARALAAVPLALWCTATLAYNLAMRDLLAANAQRWQAFALLAEHGGMAERRVSAPDFWTVTGVSSMPEPLMPQSRQYWMDRARDVHGANLTLLGRAEAPAPGDVLAGYAVAPNGRPALWIEEEGRLRLLTTRPGHWIARGASGEWRVDAAAWRCEGGVCRAELPEGFSRPPSGPWLRPARSGADSLPERLALPRGGAFGAW